MEYSDFLKTKVIETQASGFAVEHSQINSMLFDFQNDIDRWALERGRAAIFADCGAGKGQPYGSLILTLTGWRLIEMLRIGDRVIASDGRDYPVTGVYPKGEQPTYRVHFSDRVSFVVDGDHLHIVRSNNDRQRGKAWKIESTNRLLHSPIRYGKDDKSRNYDIPVVAPIQFSTDTLLPVDPYLLGVLIGDGCLKLQCSFSSADIEIVDSVKRILGAKFSVRKKSKYDHSITYKPVSNQNPLNAHLHRLGLRVGSIDKFIPSRFLFSTTENRFELLRGLMDTDGHIDKSRACQFYTISPRLADDVLFLIRSLGGIPTTSVKKPTYRHKGELRKGQPCYVITFSIKTGNPFALKRKAEKWNPNPRDNGRWIDKIEFEKTQPTICISVDSPDRSYVTEHFIVTHNTPMQAEWAEHVMRRENAPVIILAPLAVSHQTVKEGKKFGIDITLAQSDLDIRKPGIYVTNYEKLHHFPASKFAGVVPDESSILKSYAASTRNALIERFADTPFKLCCTATPAPNDHVELGNHSEFLNGLTRTEMLSTFFVHDGGDTSKWRLKGHAEEEFWKWVCSWAVMMRRPSDLGYEDGGFQLPALNLVHHVIKGDKPLDGFLFTQEAQTLNERRQARRNSLAERAHRCAEIVATKPTEPWLIWCDLNDEGDLAEKLISDAVQVAGRHSDQQKEDRMMGFTEGRYRVLVSKPSIAGWGMNWQHCSNVVFLGLSDSWEQYYQAIRRCWRFGQQNPVDCHIITSEAEGAVVKNIERKEKDALRMAREMVKHMSVYNKSALKNVRQQGTYMTNIETGNGWEVRLGDCIDGVRSMPDNSVHYSLFSPPFSALYVYSASERDMGNVRSDEEFAEHFSYLVSELYRVLMPGRLVSFHCMDIPSMKERDGVIGLKDFPGDLIRTFQRVGFIYHSKATIWKDPLIEATRTKSLGLMHKQVVKDSAMCRQGLPDYLITMRKPGENAERIARPNGFESFIGENEPKARKGTPVVTASSIAKYEGQTSDDPIYSHQVWRRYASPVWMDINQSRTLQKDSAREEKDERHVCPTQLDVIERAIELWTNPNDLVYSPFTGIGSEGYVAIERGRRFIGDELKLSHWKQACANLKNAENALHQDTLFAETV